MMRTMLKGKIHRATVTGSELHYEGSITIDATLLEATGLVEYEQVQIYDVDNGERFTTYAIVGERDSGIICVNGAAARKVAKGDKLIIAHFAGYDEAELSAYAPTNVYVDVQNKIVEVKKKVESESQRPRVVA